MTTTQRADTLAARFPSDWRAILQQPETTHMLERLWDAGIDAGDETEKTWAAHLLEVRERVLTGQPVRTRDLDHLLAALADHHRDNPR